tara:strand:- start:79 stop:597 length:519 start_codon:yes stop_codon:yes gene_type:complete
MSLEEQIKRLVKILEESNISKIEVSTFWSNRKIKLSKDANKSKNDKIEKSDISNIAKSEQDDLTDTDKVSADKNKVSKHKKDDVLFETPQIPNVEKIVSPMVGTYYQAPTPDDKPFVKIGQSINEGDTICIIEAMKIFNEIESEISGIIKEVLITDGSPVEYGQELFLIEKK